MKYEYLKEKEEIIKILPTPCIWRVPRRDDYVPMPRGFGMGMLFGMFIGAMGDMQPIQMVKGREIPQAPLREQARAAYLSTKSRSISLGKNFAGFSAIFLASECVVEKMRAKHDIMNSVYSGCITGLTYGVKQGPQAAAFGCAGMAAFSACIDLFMNS